MASGGRVISSISTLSKGGKMINVEAAPNFQFMMDVSLLRITTERIQRNSAN
jgi:hypothetical protein